MIVCSCRVIRDRDIQAAAEAGATRCAEVFRCLGTTPNCGRCAPNMRNVLERHRPELLEPMMLAAE